MMFLFLCSTGEINQRTDCSSLAEDHCYSDYKLWMIKYCSGTCSGKNQKGLKK